MSGGRGVGLREERISGGATSRHVHGPGIDQPLATVDGSGTPSYYLADHFGSLVQTTNAAGQVTLTRQYDPFGRMLAGSTVQGYAFTGREWDPETGLYFYRARYFDPALGRFISVDPAGFVDGPSLYAYVRNGPVRFTDPSGNQLQQVMQAAPRWLDAASKAAQAALAILTGYFAAEQLKPLLTQDESKTLPGFSDPTVAPGPEWVWKGKAGTKPGDPDGSWHNPSTGESLRPDLDHKPPIGPHWDYKDPTGKWWRKFPDGKMCPE